MTLTMLPTAGTTGGLCDLLTGECSPLDPSPLPIFPTSTGTVVDNHNVNSQIGIKQLFNLFHKLTHNGSPKITVRAHNYVLTTDGTHGVFVKSSLEEYANHSKEIRAIIEQATAITPVHSIKLTYQADNCEVQLNIYGSPETPMLVALHQFLTTVNVPGVHFTTIAG